jgi:hypothetical protein
MLYLEVRLKLIHNLAYHFTVIGLKFFNILMSLISSCGILTYCNDDFGILVHIRIAGAVDEEFGDYQFFSFYIVCDHKASKFNTEATKCDCIFQNV